MIKPKKKIQQSPNQEACHSQISSLFVRLVSHQPTVLLSKQTSHQQSASSTFLSEQIITNQTNRLKKPSFSLH
jgi:hypothetical protein